MKQLPVDEADNEVVAAVNEETVTVSRFTGDGYEQPTLNRAQIEENYLHAPNAIAQLVGEG
jgi:hypothetical protein